MWREVWGAELVLALMAVLGLGWERHLGRPSGLLLLETLQVRELDILGS